MEKTLQEFGLTEKEVKVYLALLKLGIAQVQEISKKAGTYRTYTYEILKSLKEKGLVSYVIKSGVQYYEVAKPGKLINILKEKEAKIEKILPELEELYEVNVEKPRVEIYEGKEGIKTILDDLLKTNKEILVYGSTKNQIDTMNFYFPNFINKRIKQKVKTKVITEKSEKTLEMHKKDKKELRQMKFFPSHINFPTVTNIYENKVAIFSFNPNLIGIIIENENVSKTQKMVFDLLWKISKV